MIKLIVFLGNPGKQYEKTRHNIGFTVCDHVYPSAAFQKKFHGEFATVGTKKILKPMTYMNISGQAVTEMAHFFNYKPEEILVVHDDLELPFGTIKVQQGGGLQGHNGLKSIKQMLSSDQFSRLRFGIGRPKHGDVASFVLSRFTSDEEIQLPLLLDQCEKELDKI